MEKIKNIFDKWISKKTDYQISTIDKISSELNMDPTVWFETRFVKNIGDYAGADAFYEMLNDFIGYIDSNFENSLLKYLPPDGINIYNKPYISIDCILEYKKGKFYIDKNGKKNCWKKFKTLTLNQKLELMENKLFSYVVNQTNLKIFSKKNIRVLKLKSLNEKSLQIKQSL